MPFTMQSGDVYPSPVRHEDHVYVDTMPGGRVEIRISEMEFENCIVLAVNGVPTHGASALIASMALTICEDGYRIQTLTDTSAYLVSTRARP